MPFALLLLSCTLVHPNYLAFFNVLAPSQPERFVVDGELDWGQDLLRLYDEVERRGIRELV